MHNFVNCRQLRKCNRRYYTSTDTASKEVARKVRQFSFVLSTLLSTVRLQKLSTLPCGYQSAAFNTEQYPCICLSPKEGDISPGAGTIRPSGKNDIFHAVDVQPFALCLNAQIFPYDC